MERQQLRHDEKMAKQKIGERERLEGALGQITAAYNNDPPVAATGTGAMVNWATNANDPEDSTELIQKIEEVTPAKEQWIEFQDLDVKEEVKEEVKVPDLLIDDEFLTPNLLTRKSKTESKQPQDRPDSEQSSEIVNSRKSQKLKYRDSDAV